MNYTWLEEDPVTRISRPGVLVVARGVRLGEVCVSGCDHYNRPLFHHVCSASSGVDVVVDPLLMLVGLWTTSEPTVQ